jgi:hypothetical protein
MGAAACLSGRRALRLTWLTVDKRVSRSERRRGFPSTSAVAIEARGGF